VAVENKAKYNQKKKPLVGNLEMKEQWLLQEKLRSHDSNTDALQSRLGAELLLQLLATAKQTEDEPIIYYINNQYIHI
jgi:hypothetical protein